VGSSSHDDSGVVEVGLGILSSLFGVCVVGLGNFPFGESISALCLHGGLMSKGLDVERLGKFGERSSFLGFGVPLFSEFHCFGCNISCVEEACDLDATVTSELHGFSDVVHANACSILHGRG